MRHGPWLFLVMVSGTTPVLADLQHLEDEALADVRGQGGFTLETELQLGLDRLSYLDDGQTIQLEGLHLGSSEQDDRGAYHQVRVNIDHGAALNLDYLVTDRRIEFGDVRLAGAPGVGMGGVFFDHSLQGSFRLRAGGVTGGAGYSFDSAYTMTGGRLGYRTNGNEVFLDDVWMDVEALGMTLDLVGTALRLEAPHVRGQWRVGAIRYSDNPLNHGRSRDLGSGDWLPSYGGLEGDYELSTITLIQAGGRRGEGVRLDHEARLNTASFIYLDDGHPLAFKDISGDFRVNDLRLDVDVDGQGRPALALTATGVDGALSIGALALGDQGQSLGAVNFRFLFQDHIFAGRQYRNAVYLQGGGHPDAGPQGLRLATEWSLPSADLSYTDDGHRVVLSGLQSWGQGDITVNVTRSGERNGTRFYDGLRIGFEGVKAGYRINGLRVGDENAPLQGGTELLLALGVYPAYEFELDGQVTLGPGGASGEGIRLNSDLRVGNGRAALIVAPYDEGAGEVPQKGLWIADLEYEGHVREMTLDVTDEGLALVQGEAWSTLDVGNLRLGDKDSGASFGRFVLERYEQGSVMTVVPGGAGDVCIGGQGSSGASCETSGGRWEARGEQGITVRLKQLLVPAAADGRRNALTWEAHRARDSQGNAVNGSGMRLVLDDIHTSDGGDLDGAGAESNDYGIRTELGVDVYQTRVVKKQNGPDSLGVQGNRGDEKIMDPSAPQGYRYVSNPSVEQVANRPLGFAVQARTRFKELSVRSVDLIHPTGGRQTAVYGVRLQNVDLRANLTATPMP